MTGKPKTPGKPEPTYIGWTWRAHLDEVHKLVTEERWLEVAKRLSGMLAHALDKAVAKPQGRP